MKRFAFIAAGALLAGLMIGTAAGRAHRTGRYPNAGTVIDLDYGADVVTFADGAGRCWSFYGTEDWMIGDGVAVIMDDNGTTETVYDDEIVTVRYVG